MHQMPYTSCSSVYVEILEQPIQAGVRFRYKCEGRSAGCIRGARSSENSKSFPTIKVHGYIGPATCVVSCVTKEGPPYYPHPHNLVGKYTSGNGICCRTIDVTNMTCSFPNLGIQCVKKKDINDSLLQRQRLNIDPFRTGFSHNREPQRINLSSVRLCFQVFIPDSNGKISIPLKPVVSEPIFDHRAVSDLTIVKLSHYSSPVAGGQEIILLCDQVNKDDIEIIFFEEKCGNTVWTARGHFLPHHVHRKAAISFITPAYKSSRITEPVEVFIQLRRPSDGVGGKPKYFTYTPLAFDPDGMLRKKQKFSSLRLERLLQPIQNEGGNFCGNPDPTLHSSHCNVIVADKQALHKHFYSGVSPMDSKHVSNYSESSRPYYNENIRISFQGQQSVFEKHSQHFHMQEVKEEDQMVADEVFEKLDLNFDSFEIEKDASNVNFEPILDSYLNYSLYELDVK